jgi:hypothetical protein
MTISGLELVVKNGCLFRQIFSKIDPHIEPLRKKTDYEMLMDSCAGRGDNMRDRTSAAIQLHPISSPCMTA